LDRNGGGGFTGAAGAPMTGYRGRFAPSPSGRLHFGSLVAALGSWLFARAAGGAWIVRMEDLDREREAPGAAARILETLRDFGLESDETVICQSERDAVYRAALERLAASGDAYPCWCSRADLEPFGGLHPGRCVASEQGARAPAWRMRVPDEITAFDDAIQGAQRQDLGRDVGDFVIWRVEGNAAYQLAVVVDDAAQGITDVVRGADLLDSTPRQLLLQRRLGLPHPRYAHLPLALGADARKLSKHEHALPVDAAAPLPALRAALGFLGQPMSDARHPDALLCAALRDFDAAKVPRSAAAVPPYAALRKDVC